MPSIQSPPATHLSNLSPAQTTKLKQMWSLVLDMLDPKTPNPPQHLPRAEHKSLDKAFPSMTPETLLTSLLNTTKQESPDRLLARFLQARKWDVHRAFTMLANALVWRTHHQHVDDAVVANSELQALHESRGQMSGAGGDGVGGKVDARTAQLSGAFLEQLRMGKCFVHGTDRFGRPVLVLQGRLHRSTEKTEVLNRVILHMIESLRLVLVEPVEDVTVVFDMTGFSISNMEYAAAKFLIECAQTAYPEILGAMLIHNAPWGFSGIWKTMKRWIDPEIAARIHFTSTTAEIEHFIAPEHLVKTLHGQEDWTYQYIEPIEGENAAMEDGEMREKIWGDRMAIARELLSATAEWVGGKSADGEDAVNARREEAMEKLRVNYWALDPYVRGRTWLDRTGVIGEGGKIDLYPPPVAGGV